MIFQDGSFSFVIHTTPIGRIVQKYYQRCHITDLLLAEQSNELSFIFYKLNQYRLKRKNHFPSGDAKPNMGYVYEGSIIPVCFIYQED